MAKKKTKRLAVLRDGTKQEITGENGRYWVCGNRQFRKAEVILEEMTKDAEDTKHPAE